MLSPTQQLHQRNQELALINEASQAFNSTLNLADVLQTILQKMHALLDITATSLWLLDAETGELVCHHATGPEHEKVIGWRLPPGQGLSWHAIQSGETVITQDTRGETRHYEKVDQQAGLEFRSIVNFPLKVRGTVIGVLNLVDTQAGRFSERDLQLLTPLMTVAATAIENARLFKSQQQAKEAAEAANRAKSMFLANMSHELRTPLNVILGFAQVMANKPHSPEDQEYLDTIQRSGQHLLALINQVLDLSKIEAGRLTLNETEFDLHQMLDDLGDLLSLRAGQKGLRLEITRAPDVPRYVCTDEVKLRQVLINLLSNAIKFTKEGRIELRIEPTPYPSQEGKSEIRYLKFEISDTGPGIAPEEMAQVFEPFGQTETGRKSQEGTGLGLPISRKFAQLMGGDITLESQIGQGTTFTVIIQVKLGSQTADSARQTSRLRHVVAVAPGQPRYRLLIVDDIRDNRQVLVNLLAPFGFDLREAENGQEAIAIWEEWQPHLIFMDMRMPVLNGYDATRAIRRAEVEKLRSSEDAQREDTQKSQIPNSKSKIPIIALTASSYDEQRAEILAVGCDAYVRKPFQLHEIFELLHEHIGTEYVYAEEEPGIGSQELGAAQAALTPAAVAALPGELLETLEQAAIRGDTSVIKANLQTLRPEHNALADGLTALVHDFDYGRIVELIRAAQQIGYESHPK